MKDDQFLVRPEQGTARYLRWLWNRSSCKRFLLLIIHMIIIIISKYKVKYKNNGLTDSEYPLTCYDSDF